MYRVFEQSCVVVVGVVFVVLGALVVGAGVVVGQLVPFASLFLIVVPSQHLNWYVAHEPVVVALVVVGLGVVTQLVPSLFLFFVSVPGQHPCVEALHAAAVVVAASVTLFTTAKSKINAKPRNISLSLF